jgi:hypothetical protein
MSGAHAHVPGQPGNVRAAVAMGIGTTGHCDDGEKKAHEWSRATLATHRGDSPLDACPPPPGCEKISGEWRPAVCPRRSHKDPAKNPPL